jgi:hypothetical protein
MEDIEKFTLLKDSPIILYNHRIIGNKIRIVCSYCNKVLLNIKSEPRESWPTLQINCKKMDLTCQCGKIHTLENKLV